MKNIEIWCNENEIQTNKNKSGVMIIRGNCNVAKIDGYPNVNQYEYLGMLIDKKYK